MKYNKQQIYEILELHKKTKHGSKYSMNEVEPAKKLFGATTISDNLDVNKVYAMRMYSTFFVEFPDMETHDEWYKWCEDNIYYAFYDPFACYDIKGGYRSKFVNQFIKDDNIYEL